MKQLPSKKNAYTENLNELVDCAITVIMAELHLAVGDLATVASHAPDAVRGRMLLAGVCRSLSGASYPKLSAALPGGNVGHTTALNRCSKYRELDEATASHYETLVADEFLRRTDKAEAAA